MLSGAHSLLLCAVLVACGEGSGAGSQPAQGRTTSLGKKLSSDDYDLIAEGVVEGPAIAVADLLADPEAFAGSARLRVEGVIVSVCQAKGCWIDVGTAEDSVHVVFAKGCDRYVPPDAAGRTVLIEGSLSAVDQSAAERRHYLEDAGRPEEAARVTGARRIWSFLATGAAVRR